MAFSDGRESCTPWADSKPSIQTRKTAVLNIFKLVMPLLVSRACWAASVCVWWMESYCTPILVLTRGTRQFGMLMPKFCILRGADVRRSDFLPPHLHLQLDSQVFYSRGIIVFLVYCFHGPAYFDARTDPAYRLLSASRTGLLCGSHGNDKNPTGLTPKVNITSKSLDVCKYWGRGTEVSLFFSLHFDWTRKVAVVEM